jgi:DegV family protein with EDD domain
MIGIITDTMSEVPKEVVESSKIEVVPSIILIEDKEYEDRYDKIKEKELLKKMEKIHIKTSLPTYLSIKKAFNNLIESGVTKILIVTVSSGLSGTFNSFNNIAKEIRKDNPEVDVELVDSLNVGIGSGLLVYKASEMIKEGFNFEEIVNKIRELVYEKSKVFFTIPTLKHLKAGGRIGAVSASIGEIMNIKPIITVGKDGIYHSLEKVRGMKKAVTRAVEIVKEFCGSEEIDALAVEYVGEKKETKEYIESVLENLKELNPKKLFFAKLIAPSLVVNTGDGLIGIGVLKK